jgi:transcriptional regulator with XRE-family HTH domain
MDHFHDFSELRVREVQDPEVDARMEEVQRAIVDALALGRVREARNLTQRELATAMSVSQANVSRIEHEEDVYLSTLREYVHALGGELRLEAVFPDETISLVGAGEIMYTDGDTRSAMAAIREQRSSE